MVSVSFVIPGRIGGKGRPKFVRATGRAYTPAKTRANEAMIRVFAADAMRGLNLLDGPLHLSVSILIQPPASWSKKRKATARYVVGKPDCDNILKGFDSCNGVVWRDDSQIAKISFERLYTDGPESVTVTVMQLTEWTQRRGAAQSDSPLFGRAFPADGANA